MTAATGRGLARNAGDGSSPPHTSLPAFLTHSRQRTEFVQPSGGPVSQPGNYLKENPAPENFGPRNLDVPAVLPPVLVIKDGIK